MTIDPVRGNEIDPKEKLEREWNWPRLPTLDRRREYGELARLRRRRWSLSRWQYLHPHAFAAIAGLIAGIAVGVLIFVALHFAGVAP